MIMLPCSIQSFHPIYIFQLRQNAVILQQPFHNPTPARTGYPPKHSTPHIIDNIRVDPHVL